MRINMVGAFIRNSPFGTEIAFAKGLEQLGHDVNRIDTSYEGQHWEPDADATVVFKWMDRDWDKLKECGGVKIVYQPDDARFPHIKQMLLDMRPYCDHVLTFDDYGVQFARVVGYRSAKHMLLTADPTLYSPPADAGRRDIDVCFIGSLTGGSNHSSRRKMVEAVQSESKSRGWNVAFGETYFDGKGLSPADYYRRSKVALNHATDVGQPFGCGYGLQCRHFEVGMTRTALVSNTLLGEDSALPFARFSDIDSLLGEVARAIEHHESMGSALYDAINAGHLPVHRGIELVQFIESCR